MFWRMVSCLAAGIVGSFGFFFFMNKSDIFLIILYCFLISLYKAYKRAPLLTAFVCISYNEWCAILDIDNTV